MWILGIFSHSNSAIYKYFSISKVRWQPIKDKIKLVTSQSILATEHIDTLIGIHSSESINYHTYDSYGWTCLVKFGPSMHHIILNTK